MKIEKIKKLKDKEVVKVAGQENCNDINEARIYVPGDDCLDDCTDQTKPRYYMSQMY